jgi:thiol-disulfide isomerase/thioredoxin
LKKWLLISWLLLLFSGIFLVFWYNEWIYSLPTPVPGNYKDVSLGTNIRLPQNIHPADDKPVFIHFFNPDCPCSRFNIPEFKSLVEEYGDKMNFAVIVMTDEQNYTIEKIQNKLKIVTPVSFDRSLAASCGVYSTPQAVIIDPDGKLYYRGNYNKSRYCTDRQSNFARMAIDSVLAGMHRPVFSLAAVKAYGCQMPGCNK